MSSGGNFGGKLYRNSVRIQWNHARGPKYWFSLSKISKIWQDWGNYFFKLLVPIPFFNCFQPLNRGKRIDHLKSNTPKAVGLANWLYFVVVWMPGVVPLDSGRNSVQNRGTSSFASWAPSATQFVTKMICWTTLEKNWKKSAQAISGGPSSGVLHALMWPSSSRIERREK